MSGPKGYSYRVESAEERARRELQAVDDRCTALAQRIDALAVEARALGVSVTASRYRSSGDLARATRSAEDLAARLDAARTAVEAARAAGRLAAVREALGGARPVLLDLDAPPDRRSSPAAVAERTPGGDWHEAVRASVEHAAAAVAEVTDAERAHRLVVEAQAVLQATTEADARRGLAVLQAEVTAAVRTARAAAGLVRRTDEILLRLGADSSPEARELRERAGEVRDEAALEQLRRDVEQVCSHRERQADRDFVLRQALESLRSLGYTVDAEPTPAVGEGVTVLAQRRGLSSHALQLTVLPERELLLTSVVALGDSTAQQDAAAEQKTCGDVQELAADMEGVRTRMVHHRPPGEVPVEHLSGAQRARRRARRATREHGAGR